MIFNSQSKSRMALTAFSVAALSTLTALSTQAQNADFDPYSAYRAAQDSGVIAADPAPLPDEPLPIDVQDSEAPEADIPEPDIEDTFDLVLDDVKPETVIGAEYDSDDAITYAISDDGSLTADDRATPESEILTPQPISPQEEATFDATPTTPASLAAFYLSAADYHQMRGEADLDTLRLDYDILHSDSLKLTEDAELDQSITVMIGPDFAVRQDADSLLIYDFNLNRIIRVQPENFSSTSLFASVYRNVQTISAVTQNGSKETVSVSPTQTTDAFWIEASLGTAVKPRESDITYVMDEDASITATYKNTPVVFIEPSDIPYDSAEHSDSMLVYAHHNLAIHPSMLQNFYQASTPPKRLSFKTVSPRHPDGRFEHWVLTEHERSQAPFPLPVTIPNFNESETSASLVQVVRAAAADKAAGFAPTPSELGEQALALLESGNVMNSWLTAQSALAHASNCALASMACDVIAQIEARPDNGPVLRTLIGAFRDSEQASSRLRAVAALQPWASQPDTAGIILRVLATARSKISKADAQENSLTDIDIPETLLSALTKDPFDPNTYIGLAQYYAANGELEASWDIYDALRASGISPPSEELAIDRAESGLRSQAPGYFKQQ